MNFPEFLKLGKTITPNVKKFLEISTPLYFNEFKENERAISRLIIQFYSLGLKFHLNSENRIYWENFLSKVIYNKENLKFIKDLEKVLSFPSQNNWDWDLTEEFKTRIKISKESILNISQTYYTAKYFSKSFRVNFFITENLNFIESHFLNLIKILPIFLTNKCLVTRIISNELRSKPFEKFIQKQTGIKKIRGIDPIEYSHLIIEKTLDESISVLKKTPKTDLVLKKMDQLIETKKQINDIRVELFH